MPGFWHPLVSKQVSTRNGLTDQVKKCRQTLNNLEIKIVALENKIHYNFYSIEDILKDLHLLQQNYVLKTHAVLHITANQIIAVIKKIFHATPSQAEDALRLISKAVEAMDVFVYNYYFDGRDNSQVLEQNQLLISEWLNKVQCKR